MSSLSALDPSANPWLAGQIALDNGTTNDQQLADHASDTQQKESAETVTVEDFASLPLLQPFQIKKPSESHIINTLIHCYSPCLPVRAMHFCPPRPPRRPRRLLDCIEMRMKWGDGCCNDGPSWTTLACRRSHPVKHIHYMHKKICIKIAVEMTRYSLCSSLHAPL